MRDYSKYPVFSQEDINEEFEKATNLQLESNSMSDNSDTEAIIRASVRAKRAWQLVNAMIEANFAVINGKKTIEQANEVTDEFMFDEEYIEKQVEKRLKEIYTRKQK